MSKDGKFICSFKKFLKLPFQEKSLLCEAFFCMIYASLLIYVFSFKRIAPKLGKPMTESPASDAQIPLEFLKKIKHSLKRAQHYSPRGENCLVQGIAGKFMLKRRKIASTLYLGLNNKEEKVGPMAHAWLRCGPVIITGSEGSVEFTAISFFGENTQS